MKNKTTEKIILSRTGDIVSFNGANITVPGDRSAVSILGNGAQSRFTDGAIIEPPWIFHKDGTKSPLYTRVQGHSIQETRFYDVHKAEKTLWRITKKCNRILKEWQVLYAEVEKKKGAYGYAKEWGERWIKWEVSNHSLSWRDVAEGEKHKNVKLGNALYENEQHFSRWNMFKAIAVEVFSRATAKCCPELYASKNDGITKVKINGRHYIFQRTQHTHYTAVKLIASPGDSPSAESYLELEY